MPNWPDADEVEKLLGAANAGETGATDELLERHRDVLRQIASARMDRALSRRVDASDIVQDVMIDASQRLQEYLKNPKLPFRLWLRQMVLDRIIDTHRRHRVAARRSLDREQPLTRAGAGDPSSIQLVDQVRDQQLTPAAAVIRHELQRRFLDALDQMAPEDREILLLRHVEQVSSTEAAEILGISTSAAGMRLLRALRRLRELLGSDAPSSDAH